MHGPAGSRSSSSQRDVKLRMLMLRYGIRICSDGILYWNGLRRQSRTWMLYGKRRVPVLVMGLHCQVKRENSTWMMETAKLKRWTSVDYSYVLKRHHNVQVLYLFPRH